VPFCDTIKHENLKDICQEMNFIFCILDVEKKITWSFVIMNLAKRMNVTQISTFRANLHLCCEVVIQCILDNFV